MQVTLGRQFALLVAVVCGILTAAPARADVLRVGTGLNFTWNRAVDGTNSPFVTIPVFNDGPFTGQTIAGWSLRLALVQVSGPVVATFDLASAAYPANHVLSFPDAITKSLSSGQLLASGSDADAVGDFADGPDAGTDPDFDTVPASGDNLLTFRLTTASPLTSGGVYEIRALNNAAGSLSNWTDQDFNDISFSNVPAVASTSVLLGTVTIQAVPEPGSMALLGVASLAGAGYGWRRRRQAAAGSV